MKLSSGGFSPGEPRGLVSWSRPANGEARNGDVGGAWSSFPLAGLCRAWPAEAFAMSDFAATDFPLPI
jgi:hypothetical protein